MSEVKIEPSTPPPGSDEAIRAGCKCPILDNGHGAGFGGFPKLFWITEGCPLHGRRDEDV